jgi:hypothetical protein
MIYLYTNLLIPGSSISLITSIKPKAKENVVLAAILLFWKKNTSTKVQNFSQIYYHARFKMPKLSGASVCPTSHVRVSAMSLLLTAGSTDIGVDSNDLMLMLCCLNSGKLVQKLKYGEAHRPYVDLKCLLFLLQEEKYAKKTVTVP